MYAAVCCAYRAMEVAIKPCATYATLILECGEDLITVTLTDEQLHELENTIGTWLDQRATEQTKNATAATVAE